MSLPRLLAGLSRAAGGAGGRPALKSVAELDPALLAKARRLALLVGGGAGAFGALVGVGGGVLIGPVILAACPAVPQRVIAGTSLAAVATTGLTAGAVYAGSGCVEPRSAALLAAGAVLTAPLGARLTHRLDCQALRKGLGLWLYAVAPLVPLKALLFAQDAGGGPGGEPTAPAGAAPAAALASAAAPAAQGAAGGTPRPATPRPRAASRRGGTVVTPLLALAGGGAQQVVLGTSLAAMVLPSLVGLGQHARLGNVDWRMAAGLAAGTTLGSYAGSRLALTAPPGVLEGLFAAGMLLLGRRTLAAAARGVPAAAR
ncbi:hypothetical protein HT031_004004 [Scenedesmus sp. PABB004]|nr:hypothetical protein HT031_004004 [Scenedesmus sp. PABB004]